MSPVNLSPSAVGDTTGASPLPASRRTPYFALAPWAVLGILTRYTTLQVGAAAALTIAVLVSLPSFAARRPKLLEVAGILAFAVFLALAILTHAGSASILFRYARAFATATLALIAFGSLLMVPFTEQYAREVTPPEVWQTARFKRTNRTITIAWGGVFAAMAVSHTIAGAINTTRGETIFNWVIPILLLVRMLRWMDAYRAANTGEAATSLAA